LCLKKESSQTKRSVGFIFSLLPLFRVFAYGNAVPDVDLTSDTSTASMNPSTE